MEWYDISVLLHFDVTTFVNNYFFALEKFLNCSKQNLKVRVYNGSTLVTWEKEIENQKQM